MAPHARLRTELPLRIEHVLSPRRHHAFNVFEEFVGVLDHSICSAAEKGPPETIATGWVPLHMPDGEPTIWFSSHGC